MKRVKKSYKKMQRTYKIVKESNEKIKEIINEKRSLGEKQQRNL